MASQARGGTRTRVAITLAALGLCLACVLLNSGPARAGGGQTIDVFPSHNSIHHAIGQASAGDTLRLHRGRYHESITLTKRLDIIGAPGRRPVIDAGCGAQNTIRVETNGVLLRHLKVVGAAEGFGTSPAPVDFTGIGQGRAVNVIARDTCDAEYGFNVFQSEQIAIISSRAVGFADAGIYIGGISSTGSGVLRVRKDEAFGSNRGIIVEDSAGGQIEVSDNNAHDNNLPPGDGQPTGIFLHNADGVLLTGNLALSNARFGIHLDATSDGNQLYGNSSRRNGQPTRNFRNQGSGNCGAGNSFHIPACP